MRDRARSGKESGRFHRVGNVGAVLLPESGGRASIVLAFCHRQAVLEFNDARDFLPARVVVREGNDGAVVPDKGPHHMRVPATGFGMKDARALRVFESELRFVVPDKRFDDGFGIRCIGRWIDVDMVNWPIRPTVSG
jgi:hypothetical protein